MHVMCLVGTSHLCTETCMAHLRLVMGGVDGGVEVQGGLLGGGEQEVAPEAHQLHATRVQRRVLGLQCEGRSGDVVK